MYNYPSLKDFPSVPPPDTLTIAEYGMTLISTSCDGENLPDGSQFCGEISKYPRVDQNHAELLKYNIPTIRTTNYNRPMIVDHEKHVMKAVWDSWCESGWRGVESYLRSLENKSLTMNTLYRLLNTVKTIDNYTRSVFYNFNVYMFPHRKLGTAVAMESASKVRYWGKAWLRDFAWHMHYPNFALALQDDSIRVCATGSDVIPYLKYVDQKNITCLAWRPYDEAQIAVGVENGIVIWNLGNFRSTRKPGASHARFLRMNGHSPVTSVEYSHNGLVLLSSSSFDTSIYVWGVNNWDHSECLCRIGGGGVPLCSWSPNDNFIITSTPSRLFRIWKHEKFWTPYRWWTPSTPIEAICWIPDTNICLFGSGGMIYSINLAPKSIESIVLAKKESACPLADVSETSVMCEDGEDEHRVGGKIRNMAINDTGRRLAVLFEDSDFVAVFRVQVTAVVNINPAGFIRGLDGEQPIAINFKGQYQHGAMLTIAWSSGRLQYVPFIFANIDGSKNLTHQEYYSVPKPIQTQMTPRKSDTSISSPRIVSPRYSLPVFRGSSFSSPMDSGVNQMPIEDDVNALANESLKLFSTNK